MTKTDLSKYDDEIEKILNYMHNHKSFGRVGGSSGDTDKLEAFCNFLSTKVSEEMLGTIKNYNKIIIGLTIFNLLLAVINLYFFIKQVT